MNKTESTWGQKWRGFKEYCHKPKTIFDFKDRIRALVILFILTFLLSMLVEYLTN